MKKLAEREINIWDMFWAVCLKWRGILCCAIIFMILMGGYSYYSSSQNNSSDIANAATSNAGEGLSIEDKNAVDTCMYYVTLYNQQKTYYENAALMNLDANNFWLGEVSYYVDNHFEIEYPVITKFNNISAIVNAYKDLINTNAFSEKMNSIYDEADCAMELVDAENDYSKIPAMVTDADKGFFTISIYAKDKEECDTLVRMVKEEIASGTDAIKQTVGEHDISIFQETCRQASSVALLDYQRSITDKLQNSSLQMTNFAAKFSDSQKEYFDFLQDENLEENSEKGKEQVVVTKPSVSKKKMTIGFVIGALIAFAIYAVSYMMNGKIRLEEDFEKCYGKRLLGNIPITVRKKKILGFVDRLFIRLRHLNQRYFDQEKAYEMAVANIRISLKDTNNRMVIVSGAVCDTDEKNVIDELAKRLEHDEIKLEYINPVLYNAEALERLVEVGQVIFIEKAEQSLYQEVQAEIEICEKQNVNLLGCIVIY